MPNVILVDDDRTNATLIKKLLEMDGFTVGAYPDIASARAAAQTGADAFVIDCHLASEQDGLQLLQAVRHNETGAPSDTVVVVTSGDLRVRDEALHRGATRFFSKPFSPAELSRLLTELVVR
jgi:DNA-binding response OmpR family regulator